MIFCAETHILTGLTEEIVNSLSLYYYIATSVTPQTVISIAEYGEGA